LLSKAVRLDADEELAHLDLGIVYAEMNRQSDAMRELKLAAKLTPGDVAVHWRLARLYTTIGKRAEAEAEFAKVKTLNKTADESVARKLNASRMQNAGSGTSSSTSN
jgi:predicted Zn-dependent protease